MNWLAHILLSRRDVEYQLGNLLADPFKGKLWPGASLSLQNGVEMHQAIDMFTDSHEQFQYCKTRLGSKGYLKGVVLDLLFDHFLSNSWNHFCHLSLNQFIDQFNQQSQSVIQQYPHVQQRFVKNIINENLLLSYHDFGGFILALKRVDRRLSDRVKRKDSMMRYLPIVEQQYEVLKKDFGRFFPVLIDFFKGHELGDMNDHYLHDHI